MQLNLFFLFATVAVFSIFVLRKAGNNARTKEAWHKPVIWRRNGRLSSRPELEKGEKKKQLKAKQYLHLLWCLLYDGWLATHFNLLCFFFSFASLYVYVCGVLEETSATCFGVAAESSPPSHWSRSLFLMLLKLPALVTGWRWWRWDENVWGCPVRHRCVTWLNAARWLVAYAAALQCCESSNVQCTVLKFYARRAWYVLAGRNITVEESEVHGPDRRR